MFHDVSRDCVNFGQNYEISANSGQNRNSEYPSLIIILSDFKPL